MGAGKTTVGRALAKSLQREFIDTDREIEERCGVTIPTIFEFEGEGGFRDRETSTLEFLLQQRGMIVATGGGAILREENRQILKANGFIVFLRVSVDEQLRRTSHDRNRPLLQTENPRQRLEELAKLRNPIYESLADMTVETNGSSMRGLLSKLKKSLKNEQLI